MQFDASSAVAVYKWGGGGGGGGGCMCVYDWLPVYFGILIARGWPSPLPFVSLSHSLSPILPRSAPIYPATPRFLRRDIAPPLEITLLETFDSSKLQSHVFWSVKMCVNYSGICISIAPLYVWIHIHKLELYMWVAHSDKWSFPSIHPNDCADQPEVSE